MTQRVLLSQLSDIDKTSGLFVAILLHNLTYPVSTWDGAWPAAFYLLYAGMFSVFAWLMWFDSSVRWAATVTGLSVFIAGVINSYSPSPSAALALYLTSILYHAVALTMLVRYTFAQREVLTEVVISATCLYLVLGSAFAAVHGLIFWFDPQAFTSANGETVGWQQLLYYSFVTLTTLGYGDVLPVGHVAQSAAAFEAIVGTLYTVLLLSRLVGLHAAGKVNT